MIVYLGMCRLVSLSSVSMVPSQARHSPILIVYVLLPADRSAMHVAMAGEAFHVGPAPAAQSYLNVNRILVRAPHMIPRNDNWERRIRVFAELSWQCARLHARLFKSCLFYILFI